MPKSKSSRTRPAKGKGKGRGRKKDSISVDFEGVEAGGRSLPDGFYPMYPSKITEEESSEGNDYLSFTWKVLEGKFKGTVSYDNVSLQPQALWKLRQILEAMGQEVPDGPMDIVLEEITGEENACMLEIVNEEYDGQDRPKPRGYMPLDGESLEEPEEESEDEEEEEEAPKKSRKGKGKAKGKEKKAKKLRAGSKVTFKDDDGDEVKGVILEIDGDDVLIEDSDGEEWEVSMDEITAA